MAIVGHAPREMLEHYSHLRRQAKQKAVNQVLVSFDSVDRERDHSVQ